MKIRILYHHGKDSLVGRGIVIWTWVLGLFYNWKVLKYSFSHEEIWIPGICEDKDLFSGKWDFDSMHDDRFFGQCFSSTTRGTANGVRFAPASVVLHHPERWDYIECEVDPERLEIALEEAKKLVGKKYDFWALFGFFNPFPIQDSKRWYCSEICNWFKVLCGIGWREKRISPRRSAYNISKIWGEPKPLIEGGK